jgi:hypothetical protein
MRSVRLSFIASALDILACGLLTLVLHGSLIARVEAATPPKSGGNLIRIWTVGSPHTGALPQAVVPPELRRQGESLGYTIQVEAFRAAGFAGKFRQALEDHNEPEVLTFDNYGVVSGIRTSMGWFDGVASDPQTASSLVLVHEALVSIQPLGWVMLIRSAVNYEAARALSMQPPVCDPKSAPAVDSTTIEPALWQAQETAALAARAFLACDQSTLAVISDDSRLGQKCFLPESDTQVESVKPCRVSGNRNLAFVSLVSTFSAQLRVPLTNSRSVPGVDLGQQSILAVLRNQGNAWRLLSITDDPRNTVARIPLTTHTLESSLDDGQTAGVTPEPARPLTPDGVYPQPAKGERFGDFIWQPSQSTDVIGQVVEFMWGKDTSRGGTRLFFLPGRERKLSSGFLMSGGTSVWRVWSISKGGDVAFSEQHSYTH